MQLNWEKTEISVPQHVGSEVVVKSENISGDKLTNFDSPEMSQKFKLREQWALNYENTFLSPQEFSSASEHFKLNDAVIKDELVIKEEPLLIDDPEIYCNTGNLDIENITSCKNENEDDHSEEEIGANNIKNNQEEFNESTKVDRIRKTFVKRNCDYGKLITTKDRKVSSQNDVEPLKNSENEKVYFNKNPKSQLLKYSCDKCSKKFSDLSNFTKHIKMVHNKQQRFECSQCNFKCYHQYELKRHINTVHKKETHFECRHCDFKCYYKYRLNNHIKSIHEKQHRFKCSQCVFKCYLKGALVKHMHNVHKLSKTEIQNYIEFLPKNTEKFNENFRNKNYDNQSQKHTCSECNVTVSRKCYLKKHIKVFHLKEFRFGCSQCDFQCYDQCQLSEHLDRAHKKSKPFKCGLCSFETSYKTALARHIDSVHKKLKPFKCDLCSRECSHKGDLVRHINEVHKNIKPFQCDQCNLRCSQMGLLKKHIDLVHKKVKPFLCNYCDHKTGRKASLLAHVNTFHKDKEIYSCSHCEGTFLAEHLLKKHLDRFHKKKEASTTENVNNSSIDNKNGTSYTKSSANKNKCKYCGFTCCRMKDLAKHMIKVHKMITSV